MWTIRRVSITTSVLVTLSSCLLISACTHRSAPGADGRPPNCDLLIANNVAACEQLAISRQDGNVALVLANFYARGSSPIAPIFSGRPPTAADPAVSFEWRKRAADFGNAKAQKE